MTIWMSPVTFVVCSVFYFFRIVTRPCAGPLTFSSTHARLFNDGVNKLCYCIYDFFFVFEYTSKRKTNECDRAKMCGMYESHGCESVSRINFAIKPTNESRSSLFTSCLLIKCIKITINETTSVQTNGLTDARSHTLAYNISIVPTAKLLTQVFRFDMQKSSNGPANDNKINKQRHERKNLVDSLGSNRTHTKHEPFLADVRRKNLHKFLVHFTSLILCRMIL